MDRKLILKRAMYALIVIISAIMMNNYFSSGKKQLYIMEGTKYETPIYYIDNKKDTNVLIIASIHGNEVAGIITADKIIDSKYNWANFVIIPRANIEAAYLNVRNPYYMSDLNRAFPGKKTGTDTEKIAYEIYSFIERLKPDIILDLHEWHRKYDEDSSYNSNGIIFNLKSIEFWKLIDKVYNEYKDAYPDSKIMLEPGEIDGTLNKEVFNRLEIPVVTIESNVNDYIDDRVNFQLYIIESLITNYRMDE